MGRLEDEQFGCIGDKAFDLANLASGQVPAVRNAITVSQDAQRAAQQKRAQELRDENKKLRRELAEAARIGETSEREQETIENRVHELASTQVLLAQQAARIKTINDAGEDRTIRVESTFCQEL